MLWKFYLDANLLKRSCESFCLNGGTCMLTSKGTSCSCVLGFSETDAKMMVYPDIIYILTKNSNS